MTEQLELQSRVIETKPVQWKKLQFIQHNEFKELPKAAREKLKAYESPIMQDMAKNSPHLQMDYIRLTTELQANEDNLLAIQKFSAPENSKDVT